MFKTIFSKLIVIFILILIFSFSVTGVMLYYYLDNFVSTEKVRVLEQSADRINNFFGVYLENQDNPAMNKVFKNVLESYSANTNSFIWIVDSNGYIRFFAPDKPQYSAILEKLRDESGNIKLPDVQQYRKVMLGQDPVKEIGDFYGLFKNTGISSWLTLEKPYKYIDQSGNEKIIAAVYLHTPMPEILRARSAVFGFFMFSVGVSVLISTILVYFFSLRISNPLKEINNAARVIAGGEFRKRLNIDSQDEIGELASSFNQMVSALQNLEEMRRGFIANVSHELRTPMTSIHGFIEGILDGTIPIEKQKDYLIIVRDEVKRLNRLVNDLLDLARMESGEVTLNFKNFDINELIRRSVIKLESLIVAKGLQVEANFEKEEMRVYADVDAIERVIINLMHNAIKFTHMDGKLTLCTYYQKDKVIVSVQDNGIGIDSDELRSIWERFYKSDKSRGRDKDGTGLGLAIIKTIISEHDQEIWVESELEKGTKFFFTLDRFIKTED